MSLNNVLYALHGLGIVTLVLTFALDPSFLAAAAIGWCLSSWGARAQIAQMEG